MGTYRTTGAKALGEEISPPHLGKNNNHTTPNPGTESPCFAQLKSFKPLVQLVNKLTCVQVVIIIPEGDCEKHWREEGLPVCPAESGGGCKKKGEDDYPPVTSEGIQG